MPFAPYGGYSSHNCSKYCSCNDIRGMVLVVCDAGQADEKSIQKAQHLKHSPRNPKHRPNSSNSLLKKNYAVDHAVEGEARMSRQEAQTSFSHSVLQRLRIREQQGVALTGVVH